jgi:molybdate transport system regulatory protein
VVKTSLFLRVQFQDGERLGPGKIQLLRAIDRTGSISEAARTLEMSYRRAWLLVDEMRRLFGRPVVTATPGGKRGGGAVLTPFGRDLVACYESLGRLAERASRRQIRRLEAWVDRLS